MELEEQLQTTSYVLRNLVEQGAKKVSFMAWHLGKLLLVCTSPRVFKVAQKNF